MDYAAFPFEIKSLTDAGLIEGIISAFDGVDSYGDTIRRGAYAKSLNDLQASGRKLPVLYQHDPTRPIGVWNQLLETDSGLVGKAELAMDVPDAKSAHSLAKVGALTGISIGYQVPKGGAFMDGNKRVLKEIELMEASLVTFPADTQARVTAVKAIHGARDIEEMLHRCGLSGRKAKAAASAAWRAINDSTDEAEATAELSRLFEQHTARLAAIGGQ